nr:PREDICTED: matrix-remodeling-associated protein 7 [Rhinolophus sinicus]
MQSVLLPAITPSSQIHTNCFSLNFGLKKKAKTKRLYATRGRDETYCSGWDGPVAKAEEQAAEERQEEEQKQDGEEGPRSAGPEEDDGEAFSFKYSPGKLRGNQYKKMMTREELEEEQRVQKEQLAAIFKLMKDNKETFGEMSDGDVQEQLRLYDM